MPKADSQSFLKYFLINELGNFFYSYSCFIWEVIEGNSGFLKSIPRFLKNMDAFPLTKFLMLKKCNDKLRYVSLKYTYIYSLYNRGCCVYCGCCLIAQSCLTLCNPMDCSPPGSSVHGILQAGILGWITMLCLCK